MHKNARKRAFLSSIGFFRICGETNPRERGKAVRMRRSGIPCGNKNEPGEGSFLCVGEKGRERILPVTDCRDI